jgi:DNA-binding NtrC family response regulator
MPFDNLPYREARREFERLYWHSVLQRHRGNVTAAARATGLDRTNIYNRMEDLGLRLEMVVTERAA